jgi:hypothetical protein
MDTKCQIKVAYLIGEFEFVEKFETIKVAAELITYDILPNKLIVEKVSPEWVLTTISKNNLQKLYKMRNKDLDLGKAKPNINYRQQKIF